jgi:hypothetical protein
VLPLVYLGRYPSLLTCLLFLWLVIRVMFCQIWLLEDWKQALDCNEYIVAILMDLSKAFDCLPHDILICKLSAYGLSDNATKFLLSYLSNRKQQIKIGTCPFLNAHKKWSKILSKKSDNWTNRTFSIVFLRYR